MSAGTPPRTSKRLGTPEKAIESGVFPRFSSPESAFFGFLGPEMGFSALFSPVSPVSGAVFSFLEAPEPIFFVSEFWDFWVIFGGF
jgi:hypothetical protein